MKIKYFWRPCCSSTKWIIMSSVMLIFKTNVGWYLFWIIPNKKNTKEIYFNENIEIFTEKNSLFY